MNIDASLQPHDLGPAVESAFALAGGKIRDLDANWDPARGAPVFTVGGKYTTRGWTEWTQGFQYGAALLTFDATGDAGLLELGRAGMRRVMPAHLTHVGVHDHGFNTMSTYGNLLRLAREGRWQATAGDLEHLQLAIRVSGAVQAARWTELPDGLGYVYSFNGPHSLFIDTIRSMRVLAAAHDLGHVLMGERDRRISLLGRALRHAETTSRHNVYYGDGRDAYDIAGRVAHESIFNTNDGSYRCPSSQQGYSPFSTWTRGLAWAVLGYPELLEVLEWCEPDEVAELAVPSMESLDSARTRLRQVARATADFLIANSASDGIPYWDTGAPGLAQLGDWRSRPAEPDNPAEPVDSSAAAIGAQGLLRLGALLACSDGEAARRYTQAGLTMARTLFAAPYLGEDPSHQGLLLHAVYHRPNGWDHVPAGSAVPNGEACMWGDYHLLELAVLVQRLGRGGRLTWLAPRAGADDTGHSR
jgi:hypothetical protein